LERKVPLLRRDSRSSRVESASLFAAPCKWFFQWRRMRHRQSPFAKAEFLLSRPSVGRMLGASGRKESFELE